MSNAPSSSVMAPAVASKRKASLSLGMWKYLVPLVLLALWQLSSSLGWVDEYILPAPSVVVLTFIDLLASGQLVRDVGISALRVIEGFFLAAAVGLGLGLAMGLSPRFNAASDFILKVFKPIPPIAWIPLAILWLGLGEAAKVFIIFIGAVFPILFNTLDAIRQTDGRFVDLAKVLELKRGSFVRRIILPGALPQIMTGLRIGITIAWMCVVAAELIAASSGVGYLIMQARALAQSDVVIVGMLVTGLLGKLTDDALRHLEKRFVKWRQDFSGV
ncbi:ABC transporter permease [Allopusillimonas ginsengisoli]|nr:ABC transporter permease [Allopusillimonas ginsengisoli]